jgi:outer membrane lipoprotein SlyB
MFGKEEKPVDLVTTEPVKIDGRHFEVGSILESVEAGFAMELVGGGKCRLAKPNDKRVASKKPVDPPLPPPPPPA